MMVVTQTITKKLLETIIQESFSQFGDISSSHLLDSLKFLGFHYATNAGISINIEDLKTPNTKKEFLNSAKNQVEQISQLWEKGYVSDTERFQTIIDSWNVVTENLKNRIIEYYQNFDPANNLYIMAFSGARGNMSQVRQLVGMRGLMSDQEGKIIDLPIQANFREGLSSIDYIISSYGARKGIVDTALKTADSGYLTRRLIYISQELVIREIDCQTRNGILVFVNSQTETKKLLGKILLSRKVVKTFQQIDYDTSPIIDEKFFKKLNKDEDSYLLIRSPITCESNGSICQKCYGWDLAKKELISLGETVGILAAQSIGEPGTQLTMRTFHTGGIFTSEMVKQIVAPFSGKFLFPNSFRGISYRNSHGKRVLKLQQETKFFLVNWKGEQTEIDLPIGSFCYLESSEFVRKGQIIAEFSTKPIISGAKKLKPVYTNLEGEVKFGNIAVRWISLEDERKILVNEEDGILWLTSGKICSLPKEVDYQYPSWLKQKKAFGLVKIVAPIDGIILKSVDSIIISNPLKKLHLFHKIFVKRIQNTLTKLTCLVKNYQYVDQHSILFFFQIFSIVNEKIYRVRKKDSRYLESVFFITESDIWKIHSDEARNYSFNSSKKKRGGKKKNIKAVLRSGSFFSPTLKVSNSGFFVKKDGFQMIFQKAFPVYLPKGTILSFKHGDFALKNKRLAALIKYTQQTEDIIQGLPKIEEIVEAQIPNKKCLLSKKPGLVIKEKYFSSEVQDFVKASYNFSKFCATRNTLYFNLNYEFEKQKKRRKKQISKGEISDKSKISIASSCLSEVVKSNYIVFNSKFYKLIALPNVYAIFQHRADCISFRYKKNIDRLVNLNSKGLTKIWVKALDNCSGKALFQYKNGKLETWLTLSSNVSLFKGNSNNNYVIKTTQWFLLERLESRNLVPYKIPKISQAIVNFQQGNFIDIGEPMTDGLIDAHELLATLFDYHLSFDNRLKATYRSLNKFQLVVVNSIQAIYQSQGVNISNKHIEIVVRQMTARVRIKESGNTPYLPGELVRLSLIKELIIALKNYQTKNLFQAPKYEPTFFSTINVSLEADGFLSAAGFQETKSVLMKAAIQGRTDWLRGLKECIIVGRMIPAGSSFLNYKDNLDTIYFFKKKKLQKEERTAKESLSFS